MAKNNNQTPFLAPISEAIWADKYQFKKLDGTPIDETVEDTWRRIADTLAGAELASSQREWAEEFYCALKNFAFLPAGRIVAGAGTGRRVTMSNCFVMGTIPDSMDGIFESLKEAALTMQQGGGIGYDFSTLRPKSSPVVRVGSDASGPLSFMDVWDAMCRTIMSAGSRRGAMMATMRCDHPDIMDFITAKKDPTRLRNFNVSVLVTDAFMDAVKVGKSWALVHRKPPAEPVEGMAEPISHHGLGPVYAHKIVSARDLWDAIMESTYNQAEPGVIFIDRVNKDHNLRYMESVAATNPCGEKPMAPYSSCLLGSINLAMLVKAAFTEDARLDIDELRYLVEVAIRMMDNVIDVGGFPLEKQRLKAKEDRQLGLGITGLADALAMCGLVYGSDRAADCAAHWAKEIDLAAYDASIRLAQEKGAFPAFQADGFLEDGTHASRLPDDYKARIRKHGIRNAFLTSIAPTGTISLYAGNVSSGIEPMFAYSYTRKVLERDGTRREELVEDYAVAAYRDFWEVNLRTCAVCDGGPGNDGPCLCGENSLVDFDESLLPEYFVNAQTLTPQDHVKMQAAIQPHVDSSISKTVNCPEDISFEDFKQVYFDAYESGCKGCTTYRPNAVTGSVLSVEPKPTLEEAVKDVVMAEDEARAQAESFAVANLTIDKPGNLEARPTRLQGDTYKIKVGDTPTLYVTITDIVDEAGARRPFELFINTKNPSTFEWMTALSRMVSAVFRRPYDSSFVVEELKEIFSPAGGGFWHGKYRNSTVAAIGQVIQDHMTAIAYGKFASTPDVPETHRSDERPAMAQTPRTSCPKCFSMNLKMESGCMTCADCGHSKCG